MWISTSLQLCQHCPSSSILPGGVGVGQFLWFASNDAFLFICLLPMQSSSSAICLFILEQCSIRLLFFPNQYVEFAWLGLLTQFLSNVFPVCHLWLQLCCLCHTTIKTFIESVFFFMVFGCPGLPRKIFPLKAVQMVS